ncbi:MAG: hypothetical protein A2W25_00525 [candidate division Zixibacteria bacterium RBG_16_53_22]|nr:MAG: hypothetical protein A2W25_00525 [candidate division Zixibacteria bacterium RBG_16_53_22]
MFSKILKIVLLFLIMCAASFADELFFQPDIIPILEKAGPNRPELEKVLLHYARLGDTLEYQAANFLISNMEGHCYVTYSLVDSAGAEFAFDSADYPNYDSLLKAWEVIEKEHPTLDFKKKELREDIENVKAEFLIDQIEYAFRGWREKPWAGDFSFGEFCEYILPYRGSNEPLENWRQYFWDKYAGIESLMADPADPIEAARIINKDVMTYFTFDPRYYYHPTDQGLSEMLANRLGRCEDMTNITIYAMRASGLAVTSDYTPYWANSGNNHAWNAIVTADGRVIPFMGAEANPGEYTLWNKLAKVYRKMYSKQPDNLIFQPRKQEKVPGWLAGKSYIDVTSDYVKTVDAAVDLEKAPPDSVDIAYICVFNDGQWKPIHWGRVENGDVTFARMGTDIAYLPAYYVNEDSLDPAGPPFILDDTGATITLESSSAPKIELSLISTTAKVQQVSTDGIDTVFFEPGKEYELFFWDNCWRSLGKLQASGQPLNFASVPSGRLYWLVAEGSNRDERIFTIEDGKQVWW